MGLLPNADFNGGCRMIAAFMVLAAEGVDDEGAGDRG
jgi:hypothetical protein